MEKNKPFANLFYFRRILRIGGTEQFLYEIAKKYHKYDIAVLYDDGEFEQLMRLRKLVRCIKREPGQKYYAKKAFFNFNIDAISQVEAEERIFVCHAIYQRLGYEPPIDHPKISKILGVSKYAVEQIKLQEETQNIDKPVGLCYNPLTLEKPDRVVHLISACRLEDKTKGGGRTLGLIKALDDYCDKHGTHYIWHIYTNTLDTTIVSPNVAVMAGRPDIRPFIADADYLVQLSDDMESYCYSINEALSYGTRIIRTPLSVAKELNIPENAEIVVDWDMSNAEKVAEAVFQPKKPFKYTPPADGWGDILVREKSDYEYDGGAVTVQPIKRYYDLKLQRQMDIWSESFEVEEERARFLARQGLVEIVG